MFRCDDNIVKPKRYIQFNDLVFSGTGSIDEQTESISLRENKTSRTFANGSYVSNTSEVSLVADNAISLKIALPTNNWSEEHIQAHYDFIMEQLMTPGKLWAIQTGMQLVWANCYVTSIQPNKQWVVTDDDYLVFSIELDNPDGVWYKADETKVYLEPYDTCDFLDMKASCLGQSRFCCSEPILCNTYCECCEDKCADMCDMVDLCSAQSDISFMNDFFEECNSRWRVVYNCEKAKKDGKNLADLYPHTICDGCINDVFSGSFMSTTVLPSSKWSIAIMGIFKDPIIRLNHAEVAIKGEYNGVLAIDYTGRIKFGKSWECMEFDYKEIPLNMLKLCANRPVVKKGRNDVSILGVVKDFACFYINYESVTV